MRSSISHRSGDEPIAVLSDTGQIKTIQCFANDVWALAKLLPDDRDAINFCSNRYRFLVTFFALCARGRINYLPPSRATEIHNQLAEKSPGLYIIRDSDSAKSPIKTFDYPKHLQLSPEPRELPELAAEDICALSFTSGSSGEPKVIKKPWYTLQKGASVNAAPMMGEENKCFHMVATVPAQHLWGFETSVMLPLFTQLCISDAMPFFPQDVKSKLEKLSSPRTLVTTPTHLNAMVKSGLEFPVVERILCATSPLSMELAKEVESLFGGKLIEIYGCTEMGSIASRRTALGENWTGFDAFNFTPKDEGTLVQADHVEEQAELQDSLDFLGESTFQIQGRSGDLINVGGKRGSVAQINQIIQRINGVADCAVFLPENKDKKHQRPCAIVVRTDMNTSKEAIQKKLRAEVDPVFIPRPILFASSLPRNETGKLTKAALESLYQKLLAHEK